MNPSIPKKRQNKSPLISVIMPTHNYGCYIREAIDSFLNQTYKHFELIIVDDASTDQTPHILAQYKDSRIKIITRTECSCSGVVARNDGLELAQGDFIAVADADDISLPNRLQEQVQYLIKNPQIDLLGTSYILVSEEGKIIEKDKNDCPIPIQRPNYEKTLDYRQDILNYKNVLHHCTLMFRKKILQKLHRYNDYVSSGDTEFVLRATRYFHLHNLPTPLVLHRQHNTSVTATYGVNLRKHHYVIFKLREKIWEQKQVEKARQIRRNQGSLKAAHLIQHYPRLTETFIDNYLIHAHLFSPLVFTDIANTEAKIKKTPYWYIIRTQDLENIPDKAQRQSLISEIQSRIQYPQCFLETIRTQNIDILHAHFATNGWRALHLKRKLNLPLITSFYGFDASKLPQSPIWRKRLQDLFIQGDLFLALGQNMKETLKKLGCPSHKIQIQHLGIDPQKIPFSIRQIPKDNQKTTLMYCGRLVEKKGIMFALNAFFEVAYQWPHLEFQIIGDGPLRQKLEATVAHHPLKHRIAILGALPHSEVLKKMQDAHLFILPSLTAHDGDKEGTPTVILESLASGLPTIATHHADIPEIIHHGKTGYLAPEKDVITLARHITDLLSTPKQWATMGHLGRQHIEQNYNIHREIQNLENQYLRLLKL